MANNTDAPFRIDLNTEQFAKEWAQVAWDKLLQALDKYDIGELDGPLWKSIQTQVIANNGDAQKVITKMLQYGRFRDMRVGRGVNLGQYRSRDNKRKKAPWFSKTYYSQVKRFIELYALHFNKVVMPQITEGLSGDISMEL
ncbi:hypothetical protein EOD41_10700 [Mucilaginibacter limnophilus]|uniref:Uncharacterized protein n=1 Tax=Mucilaginibacter limnophilus TaxID=1932778 RepID=A0A3S2Y172_9SPHI|nr:hypothetical protein [Mucilaginibacter limnophilus]RVU01075.1 hypothetical protein EOD41_10700 [Mucilaginibacter limnophilus]